MRNLQNKIDEVQESTTYALSEMKRVDEDIKGKAEMRQLVKLELELEDYTKKKEFSMIFNKLESYTTLESFNSMRMGFEKDLDLITQKFRRMPVNNDLNNAIIGTKEYVKTLNEHNSQKRDCHKDKTELQR